MSLELIKACKTLSMSPTQKSVLMALAWYSSDDGEFWGSVATIVEHTCLSERAVRKTLHDLTEMGYLSATVRHGTSTKYTLTPARGAPLDLSTAPAPDAPHPCTPCTPAPDAPLHQMQPPPAPPAPPPLHVVHPTPAPGAPNKQITTNTKTVNNKPNVRELAEKFGRFWLAYPKKTAKGAAEKSFAKLNPDNPLLETMIHALAWQSRQPGWLKDGGQFIPQPATWLNQRRWEDEISVAPAHNRHSGFSERDYHEGVNSDGSF